MLYNIFKMCFKKFLPLIGLGLILLTATNPVYSQTKEADVVFNFTDSLQTGIGTANNHIQSVLAGEHGIIVAGQDSSSSNKELAFTAAFDYHGNLIWKRFLDLPAGKEVMHLAEHKGLIQLSNGDFAIAGVSRINYANDTSSIPFIYVFNPNTGDSIIFREFPGYPVWKLDAFTQQAQGGLILAGVNQRLNPVTAWDMGKRVWILEVDSLFQPGYYKQINGVSYIDQPFESVNNIFEKGSKINLAVTFLISFSESYGILSTTKDTSTAMDMTFFYPPSNWDPFTTQAMISQPRFSMIERADHSGYNFIGTALQTNPSISEPPRFGWWFGARDTSGFNPLWEHTFTFETNSNFYDYSFGNGNQITTTFINREPVQISNLENKDLLLLQNSTIQQINSGDSNGLTSVNLLAFLMRTDEAGNSIWQDTIRHTPAFQRGIDNSLITMDLANNGRIVLAGSVKTDTAYPTYQLNQKGRISWLVILNDSVHNGATTGIQQLPNDLAGTIRLYPNPTTSGQVWLSFPSDLNIQQLMLYDELGRKIKIFDPNAVQIRLNDLNPGLYYLKIVTSKGITAKPIILK